ncbi:TPA: zf-TFIIB domain-containing protein [Yersinia enterocolitica]|nr:zf-TFIIB domain-containing protein [Yersinia enterocolitica]MBX9473859.1 zf-TFIIB domain-containing protein [Yersinia enterocolitica]MBX9489836.1 zf-TFIIB domain-containing protein [Yersinia enterocolitica]MBX9492765.1 zf-TFIIB domain-containing protein [Yersinia enterocolitica]HDL8052500.1 zf-TFIIB domain-containing protein [Yersinia enterocolitica]
MSEHKSIQIDDCPNSCGVWFNRGEIDRVIEKSVECVLDKYTDSNENYTPAIRRIYF